MTWPRYLQAIPRTVILIVGGLFMAVLIGGVSWWRATGRIWRTLLHCSYLTPGLVTAGDIIYGLGGGFVVLTLYCWTCCCCAWPVEHLMIVHHCLGVLVIALIDWYPHSLTWLFWLLLCEPVIVGPVMIGRTLPVGIALVDAGYWLALYGRIITLNFERHPVLLFLSHPHWPSIVEWLMPWPHLVHTPNCIGDPGLWITPPPWDHCSDVSMQLIPNTTDLCWYDLILITTWHWPPDFWFPIC